MFIFKIDLAVTHIIIAINSWHRLSLIFGYSALCECGSGISENCPYLAADRWRIPWSGRTVKNADERAEIGLPGSGWMVPKWEKKNSSTGRLLWWITHSHRRKSIMAHPINNAGSVLLAPIWWSDSVIRQKKVNSSGRINDSGMFQNQRYINSGPTCPHDDTCLQSRDLHLSPLGAWVESRHLEKCSHVSCTQPDISCVCLLFMFNTPCSLGDVQPWLAVI